MDTRTPISDLFPYTTLFRSFGDVAEHAQAEGVDTAFVQSVEARERLRVAVLRALDRFRLTGDGRVSLKQTGTGFCLVQDRKSTRLNSSHPSISYAVFCLKKK